MKNKKKNLILLLGIIIIVLIILNCPQSDEKKSESSIRISAISTGLFHSAALFNNGKIKCWGSNSDGQLGYEDTNSRGDDTDEMGSNLSFVNLGTGKKIVQIALGGNHTVVLFEDGTVKCWGRNDYGQLGYGDTNNRGDNTSEMGNNLLDVDLGTDRTAVQIAAGYYHTVILLDDGTVKCWGRSNYGQLGYGNTNTKGDNTDEMGNNLLNIDLGTDRTAVQIAAGGYHTVVILDNGTIKCWGYNNYGQLGYGNTNNRGDNADEMGDSLLSVNLGSSRTAIQIAAGGFHTAVILDNNKIKCWGRNNVGQLGYGNTDNQGDDIGELGDALSPVSLGIGRTALKLSTNEYHTAVILDDYTVKCWGGNDFGELGYEDTEYRGDELNEMGNDLLPVNLGIGRTAIQITIGGNHMAVLLDNGTVKCWGYNFYGQLGYEDTEDRGDELNEMGNNLPYVSLW